MGSFKKLLSSDIWYSNISWNIIFNKILIQLFIKSLNLLEKNANSLKIITRCSNLSSKIPRGIPRFLVKSSLNFFRGTIFEDCMNSDNYGSNHQKCLLLYASVCAIKEKQIKNYGFHFFLFLCFDMDWLCKNLQC